MTAEIIKKHFFFITKPPSGDYDLLIPLTAGFEAFSAAAAIDWMEMSGMVEKGKHLLQTIKPKQKSTKSYLEKHIISDIFFVGGQGGRGGIQKRSEPVLSHTFPLNNF